MPDSSSARYGLIVVIVGIGAVMMVCIFAMTHWQSAADVATVISSVAGIIGTMVGAYFGVQLGASGKQKVEEQRDKAQAQNRELAGALLPEQYERIRREHSELFT